MELLRKQSLQNKSMNINADNQNFKADVELRSTESLQNNQVN